MASRKSNKFLLTSRFVVKRRDGGAGGGRGNIFGLRCGMFSLASCPPLALIWGGGCTRGGGGCPHRGAADDVQPPRARGKYIAPIKVQRREESDATRE